MPVVIIGAPVPAFLTDGTNTVAVKAASTPASTTDPSLVVALSPNSPSPAPTSLPLPAGAATNATLAAFAAAVEIALDVDLSTRAADATLTGGTAKAIVRGGAKGATVAADVTGTSEGADHQALDVQLYSGGTAVDPRLVSDGTNTAAVKAASTAPATTDPALVVSISPNSSITTSNASAGAVGGTPPTSATLVGGTDATSFLPLTVRLHGGINEVAVSDERVRSRLDEIWIFLSQIYNQSDPATPAGGFKGTLPVASSKVGSTTAQLFLAANGARQTIVVVNDSTGTLYLRYVPSGSPIGFNKVSATNYTYKLFSQDRFEMPANQWAGAIEGVWDAANGTAYITEIC